MSPGLLRSVASTVGVPPPAGAVTNEPPCRSLVRPVDVRPIGGDVLRLGCGREVYGRTTGDRRLVNPAAGDVGPVDEVAVHADRTVVRRTRPDLGRAPARGGELTPEDTVRSGPVEHAVLDHHVVDDEVGGLEVFRCPARGQHPVDRIDRSGGIAGPVDVRAVDHDAAVRVRIGGEHDRAPRARARGRRVGAVAPVGSVAAAPG